MIEYEYSIKATSIKPFVNYCEENGYALVSVADENRMVFQSLNNQNIISRITITENDGEKVCLFDFKNKGKGSDTFKVATESLALELKDEDVEVAKSMLEVLEFKQSADNLRTRYVYEKDGVKFEIDKYTRPEMNVIGIEGEKEKVDKIYKEIEESKEIKSYILI